MDDAPGEADKTIDIGKAADMLGKKYWTGVIVEDALGHGKIADQLEKKGKHSSKVSQTVYRSKLNKPWIGGVTHFKSGEKGKPPGEDQEDELILGENVVKFPQVSQVGKSSRRQSGTQ